MTDTLIGPAPVEFHSTLFGTIHVWREIKALGIFTAKGHVNDEARWGFGETPEEAAKDLLRELSLKDTEDYDAEAGQYDPSVVTMPAFGYRRDGGFLVPPAWTEAMKGWDMQPLIDYTDKMLAEKAQPFDTTAQPAGTIIRIKGSIETDTMPRGWVYEKTDYSNWNTTALEDDHSDEHVQKQADEHGFDIIYTPEVPK